MKTFQNLSPTDYLRIFWRRRWYFVATFLLTVSGIGVYAWRMPSIYRSEARILVQPVMIPQDYVRPSDTSSPENRIVSIREQVQGRTFLEGIIQELQMFGYPASNFSMDAAVSSMRGNLNVVSTSMDTFIISYAATDPQTARTITNRLVEKLKQDYDSARKKRAVEADQFLDDQLRDTEAKLKAQEEKIKQFKTDHLGELPEQTAANMNALSGLQAQLAAVENALQNERDQRKLLDFRMQEQKQFGMLTSTLATPMLGSNGPDGALKNNSQVNALLASKQAELAALKIKYMPAHPDVERVSREVEQVKSQIAAETQKEIKASDLTPLGEGEKESLTRADATALGFDAMQDAAAAELQQEAEMIKNELAKREKERAEILSQIKRYQARLNLAPALEQEFMALSLDHETLRQQYTNMQSKKFQTQMTYNLENDRNNETYKVIDEPNLPEKPVFPDRVHIAIMGIGSAFLLGIGAAFGREMLDSTLGTEHEVVAALNIPVLASISEIPRKEPRRLKGVRIRHLGKTA